jgi:uncharacterized protein (DUF3084 family)
MSSGYVLILAVLILGGVIATLGDRIGTRVGKARLSLFNLRPKKTAVLVTILTGIVISASTLGLLLLASGQFRDMLLNFEVIQRRFNTAKRDLESTRADLEQRNSEKKTAETALGKVRNERTQVEEQLARINRSLKTAVDRQRETEARRLAVEAQRNQIQGQLGEVSQQALVLQSDISRLQAERGALAAQRDQVVAQIASRDAAIAQRTQLLEQRTQLLAQRDRDITTRDQVIAQKENSLQELAKKQDFLNREVAKLEQNVQDVRLGTPALASKQVLASATVRITDPKQATRAVDTLLQQANRTALKAILPGVSGEPPLLQISNADVARLASQINDGREYVVRVLSSKNYVLGEQQGVAVFADAALNREIFAVGTTVAAKSIEAPSQLSSEDLQDQMGQLIATANFRAQREGVVSLSNTIPIERVLAIVQFISQLRQYSTPIEVRAVAADPIFTGGPLRLDFVALKDGQVLFRSQSYGAPVQSNFVPGAL